MTTRRFFAYARERYQLMLTKDANFDPPWTDDPILQQYRFCNVFREDDKTTRWFAKHVRHPYRHIPKVLTATVIFRWFNRITTGEQLMSHDLLWNWDSHRARMALADLHPLVTGAFMVKTPGGMNKLEGLIWCIEQFLEGADECLETIDQFGCSLKTATALLAQFPYLGPFMAYEIVTDLRHTVLLDDAPDIMTWANPGPGATRGAGRVAKKDPHYYNRHSANDYDAVQSVMRRLLEASTEDRYWPRGLPSWEMRDVEHTLCEFDKYMRARLGQGRPKQRYPGGA